jgi:glycerate 2-kinase
MLDTLLERMKRRKGLRGICCYNQLPKPATGASATLRAAIRCPMKTPSPRPAPRWPAQEGQEGHADLLPHLRRRFGHVRPALDPHITLEDTGLPPGCCWPRARPSTRSTPCASTSPRSKADAWPWPRPMPPRSASCCPTSRCARSTRSPPAPRRPITPPSPKCASSGQVRSAPKFPPSVRAFFEREDLPESPGNKGWRPPFFPKLPKT